MLERNLQREMEPENLKFQISAAALMGAIFLLDHLAASQIMLGIYYVFPVALVSWAGGTLWGALFSLLALGLSLITGFDVGHPFIKPLYYYIYTFGSLATFLLVAYLTSRFSDAHHKLQIMARQDPLTGIMNRMGFYEMLNMEINRQIRYGYPFALALIDCDNFKAVNDALGHQEGDNLLATVADTLNNGMRKTDIVARLGNDEFAVILTSVTKAESAAVVEKLQRMLNNSMKEHQWEITFSFGVMAFASAPDSVGHALEITDKLMYEVKRAGKNSVLIETY